MLNLEIAKGKGRYHQTDRCFDTVEDALSNITLESSQKARLRDEEGNIVERVTAEMLAAANEEAEAEEETTEDVTPESETPLEDEVSELQVAGEASRELPAFDIPNRKNKELIDNPSGVIRLNGLSRKDAWEKAIDVVNYPVHLVEAYYILNDEFVKADGHTNTGRDTAINLVVVDRLRTGDYSAIASVTDRYGSMPTPSVYADLQQFLEDDITGYKLREVYVTGDGGAQQLVIECKSNALVDEDDLRLMLTVNTSSDGTTTHQITMTVWHKDGKFRIPVPAITKKLAAKHTSTLHRRSINFSPSVSAMLRAWNEEIIPMMEFFADFQLDKELAHEELDRVAKEAGIGKRHRTELVDLYKEGKVSTKSDNTVYSIYSAVSEFTESEAKTREAADRWRHSLSKAMKRDYDRYKKKPSKKD